MLPIAAFVVTQLANPTPGAIPHEPQLAGAGNLVALVYGAGGTIYASASTDRGQTFSKPVKVSEAPVLPLTRHRGPHIAISRGIIVVTAITGTTEAAGEHSHGLPTDGDLFAWRSNDGGKTWSKGVRINDVPAAPREGLHTLAADGKGDLFTAWLDNRKEGTSLYGAWSDDSGASWSRNQLLYESPDGTICQCCHPSVSFTEDGVPEVMWRNALGGSRDMYLMRSTGGRQFGKPEKLGDGTWKIQACPMDGGGIARAGGKTITAWRRGDEIFMAEPGGAETKLGHGKDVSIAASQGRIYAAWIDGEQLRIREPGKLENVAEKAAYPALVALPGGGVLAAWEGNGGISMRRLP